MARLHRMYPELLERAKLGKPTPLTDLQLQNLPLVEDEVDEEKYPLWDEMLRYWEET